MLLDDTQDPARVLDGIPLGTIQDERERARSWVRTAAQQLQSVVYLMNALQNVHETSTVDKIVLVLEELLRCGHFDDVDAFMSTQNAMILPMDAVTCIIAATLVVKEHLPGRIAFIDAASARFKDEYTQLPEIYERMK